MIIVWTLPESPRWLYANGKPEVARAVLTKYHGNGNIDSAIVELEYNEIAASINTEIETSDKRWWDYRPLFNSRPALYRIWLVLLVTVFSQFIGGSVIGYYMSIILQNVGITSSSQQLLLNALNTVFSFVSGIFGSLTVDYFGRRNLFLWGTFLTMLCYIPLNVIAALADGHVATGTGYAFIAMIFLYGIFWSFTWTPLQALYPAEVLNNEIRAKGMAFQGFIAGLASFINTYATPVALQNIGWKTYTIFLILHACQWVAMYLTVVETKGRSLEELEEIFEDPRPVKRSLQRYNVRDETIA
jgi:Na+/melibiose symporter-like transporter